MFLFQPKPYSFTYGVKDEYSGSDFTRAEERLADDVIRGSYKVALPDGRIQIVSYEADDDGYRATVSYEGEPAYPHPDQYNHGSPEGGWTPGADIFHALPHVEEDKTHSFFEVKPHALVTPGTPAPALYDDYDYDYEDPAPALVPTKIAPTHYASLSPTPNYGAPTPHPYTPKPAYASPTPHPFTPTPHPFTPTPLPYSPTPTPHVSTYAPPVTPHVSTYAPPTPHPYTPKPSYSPYSPQPAYHSTPAPPYDSPSYAPTPAPYFASTTVKSLRPKRKYGLKVPNYSTLGPHYQFYAPTTYAPHIAQVSPHSTFKEVFKRKVEQDSDYDYEYYEDDSDYVYSNNRRQDAKKSDSNKWQLIIAEHLHHEKK